jgi:hypothetical protein
MGGRRKEEGGRRKEEGRVVDATSAAVTYPDVGGGSSTLTRRCLCMEF